jgi:competence protein ComEA
MSRYSLPLLLLVALGFSLLTQASEGLATVPEKGTGEQYAEISPINLNSADAATLQQQLNGVGAVKAQAIVHYRETHGAFASVDELLEVKGIGAALLERNRSKLTVQP